MPNFNGGNIVGGVRAQLNAQAGRFGPEYKLPGNARQGKAELKRNLASGHGIVHTAGISGVMVWPSFCPGTFKKATV